MDKVIHILKILSTLEKTFLSRDHISRLDQMQSNYLRTIQIIVFDGNRTHDTQGNVGAAR